MRTNLQPESDVMRLIGRDVQIAALRRWLASDAPSVALIGAPGVGKSSILRSFAALAANDLDAPFDEIWWCDIEGVATMDVLLLRIANACGVALRDTDDLVALGAELVQTLTSRGRVLLVMDGAHRLVMHDRTLLPTDAFVGSAFKWVLTARVSTGVAQTRVFVPPLSPEAGLSLLSDSARRSGVDLTDVRTDDMAALVEQLDRMPLALELAGRWLLTMSPGQLAKALELHPQFMANETEISGVRVAIEETWRRTEPAEREAALALSAVEVNVTAEMAAALWGVDIGTAAAHLERLQWLSLVFPVLSGTRRGFAMFGSVRRFLVERLDPEAAKLSCARLAEWLSVESASWSLDRRRQETAVLEWVFGWTVEHNAPLAGRVAVANMVLAEHGDAFGPSLDQLYAALNRVIDLGPEFGPDAAKLYLAVARAHLLARDSSGASEALQQATRLTPASDVATHARIHVVAARSRLFLGDLSGAVASAEATLRLVAAGEGVAIRAMAYGVLAQVAVERLALDAARQHLNAACREAEWQGTKTDQIIVDSLAWRLAIATGAIEEISPDRPRDVSGRLIAEYYSNCGEAHILLGRFDDAAEAFTQILAASGLEHNTRAVLLRDAGGSIVAAARDPEAVNAAPFAAVTRHHEILEWHYPETRGRLFWGCMLALRGEIAAAWRQIHAGMSRAISLDMQLHVAIFRGVAAVVARLAGADVAWQALGVDLDATRPSLPAAGASVEVARRLLAGEALDPPGASVPWLELVVRRLAPRLQVAQDLSIDEAIAPTTLEIGPDWRWVRVGEGSENSLTRRHAGRGIVQCLVAHLESDPGENVDRQVLIEAGWPGERMMPESAFARFHTTMWRLRQMGFAEILVSDAEGYRLQEHITVVYR